MGLARAEKRRKERNIKKNKATYNLSREQLEKIIENDMLYVKQETIKKCVEALKKEFGFGEKRLQRFLNSI